MKTTIDLPEALLHRAKIFAAQRKTTLKHLVATGLESAMRSGTFEDRKAAALARLRKGLHLKGRPLTREELYERR